MKISIILAHPNPGSFNHAIAAAATDTLRRHGHQVIFHDLCQEQFPADYPAAELQKNAKLPPIITRHAGEIVAADGIIFVHPNWWSAPPAVLKNWVDRVLRMEVAYRFVANDNGEGEPVGLLKARSAVVFNTANTPDEVERKFYGDPLETFWKKCVFGLCGVKDVHRRAFTPVITSTPEQRAAWLAEVRKTVEQVFPGRFV
jgi:putative NADPH-quinone reductase